MATRVVLAAIAAAFIAGATIGAIIYFRPQGGLSYDRAQLRQLRDQSQFTVLLPTKLPPGYSFSFVDPEHPGVVVFQGPRGAALQFLQSPAPEQANAGSNGEEPGETVAVAGTEGRYIEVPGTDSRFNEDPSRPVRQLNWVQDGIMYTLLSGPGPVASPSLPTRDDLLRIANSLKPVDDVLR